MLGFLIYGSICVPTGIFIAIMAWQKKRNVISWLVYGILATPVAILHLIFISLKIDTKIKPVIYIALLAHILAFIYFFSWGISTQPAAIEFTKTMEENYLFAKTFLQHQNDASKITSFSDLEEFIINKTNLPIGRVNIKKSVLSQFDIEQASEAGYFFEYVQNQIIPELIVKVREVTKNIWDENPSVPLGAAKDGISSVAKTLRLFLDYDNSDNIEMHEFLAEIEAKYLNNNNGVRDFSGMIRQEINAISSAQNKIDVFAHIEFLKQLSGLLKNEEQQFEVNEIVVNLVNEYKTFLANNSDEIDSIAAAEKIIMEYDEFAKWLVNFELSDIQKECYSEIHSIYGFIVSEALSIGLDSATINEYKKQQLEYENLI